MQCPICKCLLKTGKTFYTTEDDDTPDKPTKIFSNLPMICTNKGVDGKLPCPNYGGEDLSNPTKVVEVRKVQVN